MSNYVAFYLHMTVYTIQSDELGYKYLKTQSNLEPFLPHAQLITSYLIPL